MGPLLRRLSTMHDVIMFGTYRAISCDQLSFLIPLYVQIILLDPAFDPPA